MTTGITELERAVLGATLYLSEPRTTSRAVAEHAGVSQSTVSRLWQRLYRDSPLAVSSPEHSGAATGRLRLTALLGTPTTSALLFEQTGERLVPGAPASRMHSPLRPLVQTVLAADLAAMRWNDRTDEATFVSLRHLLIETSKPGKFVLVCKGELPLSSLEVPANVTIVSLESDLAWQQQALELAARSAPSDLPRWADAQLAVRRWVRQGGAGCLEWCWTEPRPSAPHPSTAMHRPSLARTFADAAALVLERELHEGRSSPERGFTESFVAKALRTSRQQARDALRLLADDGLVRLNERGCATVPMPTTGDVMETYAIRKALGSLAVRRVVSATPVPRRALEEILDRLEVGLEGADIWASGLADLEFQDSLVALSDTERTAVMFRRLTTQLRLFVSVLGLRYEFSPAQIRSDNSRLIEAMIGADWELAVAAWHAKINGAVTFMLGTLPNAPSYDFSSEH